MNTGPLIARLQELEEHSGLYGPDGCRGVIREAWQRLAAQVRETEQQRREITLLREYCCLAQRQMNNLVGLAISRGIRKLTGDEDIERGKQIREELGYSPGVSE